MMEWAKRYQSLNRKTMKKLYLCRHGKTLWNRERRIQGLNDIELDSEGKLQAEHLALFLAKQIHGPVRVISSPLMRAKQTALPIAEALHVELEMDERLIEINTGEFTGCTLDDLKNDPRWQLHLKDPWHAGYGIGGESSESVHDRMMDIVHETMEMDDERDVILVSHASPIRHVIMALLNIPSEHLYHIVVHNASASLFEKRDDFYKVVYLNSHDEMWNSIKRELPPSPPRCTHSS